MTNTGYSSVAPAISVDNDQNLHFVWSESFSNNFEIYYRRRDGSIWGPKTRLTNAAGDSRNPSIVHGDNDDVHVAWHDERLGASEIFYKWFNGTTWFEDCQITSNAASSENASVLFGGGRNVYLFWHEDCDDNLEIFCASGLGISWGEPTRLTGNPQASSRPSAGIDSQGTIHLLWTDERDGDSEVYYKTKGPGDLADAIQQRTSGGELPAAVVGPNPLSSRTVVRFYSPAFTQCSLDVYDAEGRLVWNTKVSPVQAGWQSVEWPASDQAGRRVSPGLYFLRVTAGQQTTSKMVVVK